MRSPSYRILLLGIILKTIPRLKLFDNSIVYEAQLFLEDATTLKQFLEN